MKRFPHTAHAAFTFAFIAVVDDDAGRPVQVQAAKTSIPIRLYIPARLYDWARSLPWRAREYLRGWRRDLQLTGRALVSGGEYWQILLS